MSEDITCPFCGERKFLKGEIPVTNGDNKYTTCPVCKGTGYVMRDTPHAVHPMKCPSCDGGKNENRT